MYGRRLRLKDEPPVYLGKPSPPFQLVTYLMNHAFVSLSNVVSGSMSVSTQD